MWCYCLRSIQGFFGRRWALLALLLIRLLVGAVRNVLSKMLLHGDLQVDEHCDFRVVIFFNMFHIHRLRADYWFSSLLKSSETLILCDSKIIHMICWFAGVSGIHHNRGISGLRSALEHANQRSLKVGFVCSPDISRTALLQTITAAYPNVVVIDIDNKTFFPAIKSDGCKANERLANDYSEIISRSPYQDMDLLFLGIGSPKQEFAAFIASVELNERGPRIYCIGKAVEYLVVGDTGRIASRFGLEWLLRLCEEPKRLAGRYLRSALSIPLLIAGVVMLKKRGRP